MHSATVIPRMSVSFAPCSTSAFLVVAVIACLALAACSPGADYPSLFPSVHDIPPPRTDTPLDSNQVQQATEDLISARDRLSAEAQGGQGKGSATSAVKPPVNAASKSPANPATAAAAAKKQPGNQVSGRQTVGTDAEQTVGTETK